MARTVSVVPHTHWDREWYAPFQRFRLQLVDLLDDLLPRLEADPSFRHFLLDGQMAVVDDYLEVRPEAEATLRRLATSGRLAMGPWYALPDEFLVSGETLVRNLQLGLRRAAAFGGAMDVGYLPDMFGHVAQMPQVLAQFGFEHTVVWRGVPSAVDRSGFWWEAPDGTTIRAEYLPEGYGNGARVPDDAKALLHLVDGFISTHETLLDGPVLWMVGTDHQTPRPWLGRVVLEANELQDDVELVIRSLAEHVADAPTEGLPHWAGELRSGARANLLMGVGSNRTDVKVAAAVAERTLERLAEPLAALFTPAADWPQTLLDLAWREVIRNSAHDSVCACSHDDVVDAVLHRYAEARHIGKGLVRRTMGRFADSLAVTGAVVVNPSARTRGGMVELDLPGAGPADGLQLLSETAAEELLHEIAAADAVLVVEREIFLHPALIELDLDVDGDRAEVLLREGERLMDAPPENTTAVLAALSELAAALPDGVVRIERHGPARRRRLGPRRCGARLRLAGLGPDPVGGGGGGDRRRHHPRQRAGHGGRGPGRRDVLARRPGQARQDRRRRRCRRHLQLVTPRSRRVRRPRRDGVGERGRGRPGAGPRRGRRRLPASPPHRGPGPGGRGRRGHSDDLRATRR